MHRKPLYLTLVGLLATIMAAFQPAKAQTPETYFPYPAVPDSMSTLTQRCDYLVEHFWDFCDLKKSFSSHQKMEQAFADYLSFMPHASKAAVLESLQKFFKKLEKQPNDLLFLVDCAEGQLMGDSAQYQSEELYLEFAKAAIANKRIDKARKARYQFQVDVLGATLPGMKAPDIAYTDRFGDQHTFAADTAEIVLLMISDPTCDDCKMARLRLDANIKANVLINRRIMKVVCLTADEFSPEWQEAVKDYPLLWTIGAAPDLDTTYDIKQYPSFYFIDDEHKIVIKNLNYDQVNKIIEQL